MQHLVELHENKLVTTTDMVDQDNRTDQDKLAKLRQYAHIDLVSIDDGVVVTSSRRVAEMFGKNHWNVMRDIKTVILKLDGPHRGYSDVTRRLYRPTSYVDCFNRQQSSFSLNREGLTLLILGYTGQKAFDVKSLYLDAFFQAEGILRDTQKVAAKREH